jgi:hypothetical protein
VWRFCFRGGGCSELKWQAIGPVDGQTPSVGPLRIDVRPVDTTELRKGHPFRWRGSKTAGFMLFDLRITNTGKRDLLCQVGHFDFPGLVSPELTPGHFLEGATSTSQPSGKPELIGLDDLRLTALLPEKATILMADGYGYQILSYHDFSERYCYLMQKEMGQAEALGYTAYIPYTFGVGRIASAIAKHKAAKRMPKRLMQAQQMVMRPGMVPAGSTIPGYYREQ